MIKELPQSEASVIGIEINSKVSVEDQKIWAEKFDKAIEDHGKVSMLVVLGEEAGFGVKAGIEDLKWVMKNMKKLDKIAVVSDSNVWKWLVALDSPFAQLIGISEKHFELSELNDAWDWVKH